MLAVAVERGLRRGQHQREPPVGMPPVAGRMRRSFKHRQRRLTDRLHALGENLQLPTGRGKSVVAVLAMRGLQLRADTAWRRAQLLQRDAARRQVMPKCRLHIAVPEVLAQPEANREVEYHVDVGSCLAARRDDGLTKLHVACRRLIESE